MAPIFDCVSIFMSSAILLMSNADNAIYTVVVPFLSAAIPVIGIASCAGIYHSFAKYRLSCSSECARERVVDGLIWAEGARDNQIMQQTARFEMLGVLRVDAVEALRNDHSPMGAGRGSRFGFKPEIRQAIIDGGIDRAATEVTTGGRITYVRCCIVTPRISVVHLPAIHSEEKVLAPMKNRLVICVVSVFLEGYSLTEQSVEPSRKLAQWRHELRDWRGRHEFCCLPCRCIL